MLHLSLRACCCTRYLTHRARALHLSTLFPSKNHYEALRVSRNASREEIKSAFVTLSKTYHPDLNPGLENAKKLFVEINEAYSTLGNPVKRRRYDLELHTLEVYQSQYGSRHYAGSTTRSTSGDPYSNATQHDMYSFYRGYSNVDGFDWEEYKRSNWRPSHSRVILSLVLMMLVASGVHTVRINWAHRQLQERSDEQSRRNYRHLAAVREKADRSSVQEQLELLSKQHSETLRKIAAGDTSKGS